MDMAGVTLGQRALGVTAAGIIPRSVAFLSVVDYYNYQVVSGASLRILQSRPKSSKCLRAHRIQ
jgi:hypothetical protein